LFFFFLFSSPTQKLRVKATQKLSKALVKQNAVLKKYGYITSENEIKPAAVAAVKA